MTTIVTRSGKGSPLTWNEADANFTNLNIDKIETSDIGITVQGYNNNLDVYATTLPTAAGLALLDDVDVSAQRLTLDAQQTLVSGSNIKTINGTSILGSGNLSISILDGDKGDITVSSSGTVWTVDNNSITPDKLTQKLTKLGPFTLSGSAQDVTGIPSWVKRITVSLVGVSGAAALVSRLRIGTSAGVESTGYVGSLISMTTTPGISTTDLGAAPQGVAGIVTSAAATTCTGQFVLVHQGENVWACDGGANRNGDTTVLQISKSSIALPGVLDRLSLVATTSTFDAGTMMVLYEG